MSTEPLKDARAGLAEDLVLACWNSDWRRVSALVAAGADPGREARMIAAADAPEGDLRPLHAAVASIARGTLTPRIALRAAERIAAILLGAGADGGDPDTWVAIARNRALPVARVLRDGGARVRSGSDRIIEAAITNDQLALLMVLKDCGADMNAVDERGSCVLLRLSVGDLAFPITGDEAAAGAARDGWHTQRLIAMRDAGIDLNTRDGAGATPLMRSIVAGLHSMARALVRAGADVGAWMPNGVSAIHLAAAYAGEGMVSFLLANGARFDDLARANGSSFARGVIDLAAAGASIRHAGKPP